MVDSINQKSISATGLLTSATAAGITGGAIAHYAPTKNYREANKIFKGLQGYFDKEGKLVVDKLGFNSIGDKFLKTIVKGDENKIKNPEQLLKVCAEKGHKWAKDLIEVLAKGRNRVIIWTASAAVAGAGIYLGVKTLFKGKRKV